LSRCHEASRDEEEGAAKRFHEAEGRISEKNRGGDEHRGGPKVEQGEAVEMSSAELEDWVWFESRRIAVSVPPSKILLVPLSINRSAPLSKFIEAKVTFVVLEFSFFGLVSTQLPFPSLFS
jgi:hypothetical protein